MTNQEFERLIGRTIPKYLDELDISGMQNRYDDLLLLEGLLQASIGSLVSTCHHMRKMGESFIPIPEEDFSFLIESMESLFVMMPLSMNRIKRIKDKHLEILVQVQSEGDWCDSEK